MNKLLGFFAIVFVSFFLFDAGFSAASHHYSEMTFSLIEAAFFGSLVLVVGYIEWQSAVEDAANHSHRIDVERMAKQLGSDLERLLNDTDVKIETDGAPKPRKSIPVVDGDAEAEKTAKRRAAGLKAAETRKARQAEAQRQIAKQQRSEKREQAKQVKLAGI